MICELIIMPSAYVRNGSHAYATSFSRENESIDQMFGIVLPACIVYLYK